MAATNYDDVLRQLHAFGLRVDRLQIGTQRIVRCPIEGDREKRGWYMLHELATRRGDLLIVGSFGIWRGQDSNTQKVELNREQLTHDELQVLKRRYADDRRRAESERQRAADRAAERAAVTWSRLQPEGESDYLDDKHVGAFGLRFTPNGSAVLPLLDTSGRIHGLQFLRSAAGAKRGKRPPKEFWPPGLVKKGHFHLIGAPSWVVLVAEGYATAASLHMATGYPVAVAFDAGNLYPVAEALRKRYRQTKILVCADDDILGKCRHEDCRARLALTLHPQQCPACDREHGYTNAGVSGASAAALTVHGAWIAPRFEASNAITTEWLEQGRKTTDFNDLHVREGLHAVRVQIEAKLTELNWAAQAILAAATTTNGAGDERLKPIQTLDELLHRYVLVYAHSGAVFDRQEHLLMSISDMRDACANKFIHRSWQESHQRRIVRVKEVGFDPTGQDPEITCNLFAGWPTAPKAGNCKLLLELLRYMCSEDRHAEQLYQWVLRWVAYPIQNPGAKMKSTVVLHGPQGTGKNLFFEAVMKIYGEYGDVLDQSAVEDKFNDWASRKLFMIADEVVAQADKFHIKNQLKGLITGNRIRINPKNFAARWEANHVNLVFLSNEAMPVVLEEDDRRHCIIWTPEKQRPEFYKAVLEEIREGAVAALHDYLLHLDLGDFQPGSEPPLTAAKRELINLGLDSPLRFYDELITEDIPGIIALPGLATDWYEAYKIWCGRIGVRAAPMPKFINQLARKRDVASRRARYRPADKVAGPHAFLFMGGATPPEGQSETDWLGQCYGEFRATLNDFKEKAKA